MLACADEGRLRTFWHGLKVMGKHQLRIDYLVISMIFGGLPLRHFSP
jgi:hypothetical protein